MSDSQFNAFVSALGILLLGLFQAWLTYRHKVSTDKIGENIEKADVKRTATTKVVDQILIDVNSKSDAQNTRVQSLERTNNELNSKIGVLEERLRPSISEGTN